MKNRDPCSHLFEGDSKRNLYLHVLSRRREALVDLANLTHVQSGRVDRLENAERNKDIQIAMMMKEWK